MVIDIHPTTVRVGSAVLAGDVNVPDDARGIVLFAHGSGSSRHSPRNRAVARVLQDAGLGTFLADLLTDEEETEDQWSAGFRFDIPLLADRLLGLLEWLAVTPATARLPRGLFGASTGAAAAIVAAARRPGDVFAIVSRGGRPDLAGPALAAVGAPTLFIVGGADETVLELNLRAMATLRAEKRLEVVPGATHLFAEPGALERVAGLARDWFLSHLPERSEGLAAAG
jgi:dienelactone hydrolase